MLDSSDIAPIADSAEDLARAIADALKNTSDGGKTITKAEWARIRGLVFRLFVVVFKEAID